MTHAEILEKMSKARVLVVGDAIDDHYIFGRVDRICPEAPVPVFISEHEQTREGGAANVAHQIEALGAHVSFSCGVEVSTKIRFMAGSHMLLRIDRDHYSGPRPQDIKRTCAMVDGKDVVVLSDYAKGWLSHDMCWAVIGTARTKGIPVIVDPKGTDWSKFVGCSLICPSEGESAGVSIWTSATFPDILLKRGPLGMQLRSCACDYGRIPASVIDIPAVARHVYDVTGAGDTVVAVVAAAVAVGASFLEAAQIAALAAGFVVGEVGTTVCPLEKLKELIDARQNA